MVETEAKHQQFFLNHNPSVHSFHLLECCQCGVKGKRLSDLDCSNISNAIPRETTADISGRTSMGVFHSTYSSRASVELVASDSPNWSAPTVPMSQSPRLEAKHQTQKTNNPRYADFRFVSVALVASDSAILIAPTAPIGSLQRLKAHMNQVSILFCCPLTRGSSAWCSRQATQQS